MNLRKAFSGKSFTRRIPSKAPMPITGSIRRFSEKEPHVMLSQAKIWKGTFSRLTTRKPNKAVGKTLSDLGLDYLDLYLIHWPANELQFGKDANQLNVDTWKAMERLHEEGLIRSIGLSNFMQHHAEPVMAKANICPMVDQIEYHPGFSQKECVEFCQKNNILVEAWSPLGRGNVLDNPLLKSIAANHGKSVAQVVIRWVMQTGVLPLVKSVTPSRIKENFDVFDFELSQQEMLEIASLKTDRIGSDPDSCDF